jgi:hypothetical protein
MTYRPFRGITLAATLAMVVVAACDGGSSASGTKAVSRAVPVAKADQAPESISVDAQPLLDSYAEDARRVAAIVEWTGSTWSYIAGVRTAFGFLTGLDEQEHISIGDIRQVVHDALKEEALTELRGKIDGYMDRYHTMQVLSRDQVMSGQSMDTLLTSNWGTTHLHDNLTDLINDGTDLLVELDRFVQAQGGQPLDDRLLVSAMPAYTVLVPALISSMKLATEIDPLRLKRGYDELVSEKIAKMQQRLFDAVGAYLIYAYDPAHGPVNFYSPVGADTDGWMLSRPLYRYHYVDPYIGKSFSSPHAPFFQYQSIPIVSLALDSLEKAVKAQHGMVVARDVYVWDLRTSPVKPGNNIAGFVFGDIVRVRQ